MKLSKIEMLNLFRLSTVLSVAVSSLAVYAVTANCPVCTDIYFSQKIWDNALECKGVSPCKLQKVICVTPPGSLSLDAWGEDYESNTLGRFTIRRR
jgi:hypothetical protein